MESSLRRGQRSVPPASCVPVAVRHPGTGGRDPFSPPAAHWQKVRLLARSRTQSPPAPALAVVVRGREPWLPAWSIQSARLVRTVIRQRPGGGGVGVPKEHPHGQGRDPVAAARSHDGALRPKSTHALPSLTLSAGLSVDVVGIPLLLTPTEAWERHGRARLVAATLIPPPLPRAPLSARCILIIVGRAEKTRPPPPKTTSISSSLWPPETLPFPAHTQHTASAPFSLHRSLLSFFSIFSSRLPPCPTQIAAMANDRPADASDAESRGVTDGLPVGQRCD